MDFASTHQTYTVRAPRPTHQRKASCVEVGCAQRERGWLSVIDESTDLGKRQAGYIRRMSERRFTEDRDGELTRFAFEPGQRCFATHYVSLDREPQYAVLSGGIYGRVMRPHRNFDDWANDFGDHLDTLRRNGQ